MRETKIVIIGAGSVSFGLGMLSDAVNMPELRGSAISLVDIDSQTLEAISALAHKMNDQSGAGLKIEHTTDRTKALPDAEFVIVSIAMRRNDLWKLDWEVPIKHGVRHTLGENGGPGGLFHSMRNIPIILDICRDIERLCPNALVLNFTNPVPRVCMAIDRHSSVKAVGLCHGIGGQLGSLARVLQVSPENLTCRAAGLNHFTWILDLRFEDSGEDAYPELRRRLHGYNPGFQPLSRRMFEAFGLYPSPGDDHIGEYLPYATEYCPMHGYNFDWAERSKAEMWQQIGRMIRDEEPVTDLIGRRSGERAFAIIAGILADSGHNELAVNIRNDGLVSNLPQEAIVEAPAVVDAEGVKGDVIGRLPLGIAALCRTQIGVQELVVEAAVTGDKGIALQALLADPVVPGFDAAEKILHELLALQADYLPQFK